MGDERRRKGKRGGSVRGRREWGKIGEMDDFFFQAEDGIRDTEL